MRLREALRIQRGDVVAFIGAGGKTSALFRLADELTAEGWRVLATTTTRMAAHEAAQAPFAAQLTPEIQPRTIRRWLTTHKLVFLYSRLVADQDKVLGLHPDMITGLMDSVNSDVILVEADGARGLPLKAPYDHEPVIPRDATLVVPVAGLDALGQPLDDAHIYNATAIRERYGFALGAALLPPWMALTLRDPALGLRGVPESARVTVLLNKVPAAGYNRWRARRVAQMVLRSPRVDAVALGAMEAGGGPVLEAQQRVAAVVLAAGMSRRMGQSKALLPWDGRTVIEAIAARLITLRLAEVLVVTGHQSRAVSRALRWLPARTVYNDAYQTGEMLSSLQAGLRALPVSVAACLVVLGDQPALDPRVIDQLLTAYAEGRGGIVAPVHRGERGHPVLFDRRFWPDLLALTDGAPRDVIARYPEHLALVPVESDSILRDFDTPQDYRRERGHAGLS